MFKQLIRNIFICMALVLCTASCCVADWYHDLVYGDAPLPTDPIAPVGPAPANVSAHTPDEIVSLTTDSLIFFFTANGIRQPRMGYTTPAFKDQEISSIGNRIFGDLAKNKVIIPSRENVDYVLVFTRSGANIFRVDMVKYKTPGDFSNIIFTEQYQIRGTR